MCMRTGAMLLFLVTFNVCAVTMGVTCPLLRRPLVGMLLGCECRLFSHNTVSIQISCMEEKNSWRKVWTNAKINVIVGDYVLVA